MYLCDMSINIASFYHFGIRFWNCCDSVVFFVIYFIVINSRVTGFFCLILIFDVQCPQLKLVKHFTRSYTQELVVQIIEEFEATK